VSMLCFDSSILTVPWIELGGMTTITCPKTGYSAQINFETKVVCQRLVWFLLITLEHFVMAVCLSV